ncbi:epimerase family protein SDR39U1 isoform X3 [Pygocentrus nattereri]|uniref:epimerase family protein SDR39U1 isoform X3 n=1 Tax=Pygocentrus nattereri TaxID=42514 RepID=UPI000814933F|nr:epimerase family protein SDR39U1 isoform X3 [Pygocentrus nattereri]
MRVLIGGGSGFVGRELTRLLKSKGHEVTIISRQPGPGRITWADVESGGLPPCEGAVNLAGENIMNPLRWWNDSYKKDLFSSRVDTTRALAQAIAASSSPPRSWVLITGVGAVLGRDGGAMKQMLTPFWLGLGGPLGSGRQPFPWIHVSDLAGIILHALETSSSPPSTQLEVFNGVAPALNTNYEFTKELGRILRRPTLFPVPGFLMDTLLGSERAVILMQGQKVVPKRTLESGFQFRYPDLTSALREIVGG